MWEKFNARNAARPPDWRWSRAKLAAAGTLPIDRRRDDPWIVKAARFLQVMQGGTGGYPTSADQAAMAETWPDIYWAHYYWNQADQVRNDTGKSATAFKFGLEARILAGSTPDEIHAITGVFADDVSAYEKLFFDVRERLDQRQYIFAHVLGPAVHRGLNSRDYDLLWKLFGYHSGPAVLDMMMFTFDGARKNISADGVAEALDQSFRDDVRRHSALVGKTWRTDRDTQGLLWQIYHDAKRLENEAGGAGTANEAILTSLSAAMATISFTVGRSQEPDRRLKEWDDTALEPSSRDLMAQSTGTGAGPDPERAALEFPVPAPRQEV